LLTLAEGVFVGESSMLSSVVESMFNARLDSLHPVHGSCLTGKIYETSTVAPSANNRGTDKADAGLSSLAPNPGLGSGQGILLAFSGCLLITSHCHGDRTPEIGEPRKYHAPHALVIDIRRAIWKTTCEIFEAGYSPFRLKAQQARRLI